MGFITMKPITFLWLGVGTACAMHSRATVLLGRSPTGLLPLSGLLPLRVAESLQQPKAESLQQPNGMQTVVFLTGSLPAAERANVEWRRQCTDEWECCAVRSRHTQIGGRRVTTGCTQASVLAGPHRRPEAAETAAAEEGEEAAVAAAAAAATAEEEEGEWGGAVAPRLRRRVFFCSFVTARQLAVELDGAPVDLLVCDTTAVHPRAAPRLQAASALCAHLSAHLSARATLGRR